MTKQELLEKFDENYRNSYSLNLTPQNRSNIKSFILDSIEQILGEIVPKEIPLETNDYGKVVGIDKVAFVSYNIATRDIKTKIKEMGFNIDKLTQ